MMDLEPGAWVPRTVLRAGRKTNTFRKNQKRSTDTITNTHTHTFCCFFKSEQQNETCFVWGLGCVRGTSTSSRVLPACSAFSYWDILTYNKGELSDFFPGIFWPTRISAIKTRDLWRVVFVSERKKLKISNWVDLANESSNKPKSMRCLPHPFPTYLPHTHQFPHKNEYVFWFFWITINLTTHTKHRFKEELLIWNALCLSRHSEIVISRRIMRWIPITGPRPWGPRAQWFARRLISKYVWLGLSASACYTSESQNEEIFAIIFVCLLWLNTAPRTSESRSVSLESLPQASSYSHFPIPSDASRSPWCATRQPLGHVSFGTYCRSPPPAFPAKVTKSKAVGESLGTDHQTKFHKCLNSQTVDANTANTMDA